MVVPSPPPSSPTRWRCAAWRASARKAFVAAADHGGARRGSSRQLAERARRRCSPSRGSSAAIARCRSEISPLPAMDEAAATGAIVAFPAFADHQSPFRFLAGDPVETGPWSVLQPRARCAARLSRPRPRAAGRGRPRAAPGSARARAITTGCSAELREHGALLIGVGWACRGSTAKSRPIRGTCRSTASPRPTGWRCSVDRADLAQTGGNLRHPAAYRCLGSTRRDLRRRVGRWPALVQALFYLVAGIVWIAAVEAAAALDRKLADGGTAPCPQGLKQASYATMSPAIP